MNRRHFPTRCVLLLVAVVLAAGSVVACSSGKGSSAKSSADSGSAATQTDTDVASAPRSEPDLATILDRAVAAEGKVSSFTFVLRFGLNFESSDQRFRVSGKVARPSGASRITADAQGVTTVELRTQGDTAWLRSGAPAFRKAMPAGKTWTTGSVSDLVRQGVITPVNQSTAFVYYLYGARDIHRLDGKQRLDGEDVTAYAFTIDRGRAEQRAPAARKVEVHDLMTTKGSTVLSIKGQVWLDQQGRLHRMTAIGKLSAENSASSEPSSVGHIDYDLREHDFGVKVSIDKPSASDTVSLDSVPALIDVLKRSQSSGSADSSGSDTSS